MLQRSSRADVNQVRTFRSCKDMLPFFLVIGSPDNNFAITIPTTAENLIKEITFKGQSCLV